MGPFHGVQSLRNRLPQCGSPKEVTSPASKPAPAWAPLSMGSQVLAGACSSLVSPWGHSLLQASPCSGVGSSPGCRWGSAPPWTSMDCRDSLPHHGLHHRLQGKSHCSSVWSTSCPPSALCLVSAELFLSHSLTPLSPLPLHPRFSSLLKYPRGAATVADRLGLGQWQVCLRAGWHRLHQTRGKILAASHRNHPYSRPATTTLPRKPVTASKHRGSRRFTDQVAAVTQR